MRRCIDDMHMAGASIAYGMTETSPVSCQTRADDDLERRTATIGRVHPHVEIKVVDPATGETVERGETGEFCTRGYSVMLGYWPLDAPEGTEKTAGGHRRRRLDAHRRPRRDARGRLLHDRRADQGHGDPGRGERLSRARSRSSSTPTPTSRTSRSSASPTRSTARSCAPGSSSRPAPRRWTPTPCGPTAPARLAHYKIPRYVMTVEEFPMTVTGKIRKVEMREKSAAELGLSG